jgi:hypothetical protein
MSGIPRALWPLFVRGDCGGASGFRVGQIGAFSDSR